MRGGSLALQVDQTGRELLLKVQVLGLQRRCSSCGLRQGLRTRATHSESLQIRYKFVFRGLNFPTLNLPSAHTLGFRAGGPEAAFANFAEDAAEKQRTGPFAACFLLQSQDKSLHSNSSHFSAVAETGIQTWMDSFYTTEGSPDGLGLRRGQKLSRSELRCCVEITSPRLEH